MIDQKILKDIIDDYLDFFKGKNNRYLNLAVLIYKESTTKEKNKTVLRNTTFHLDLKELYKH